MIFAAQYRFLDKVTGKEVFYILPSLTDNQLNVLDSRLVNFSISYYKDATVPIYRFYDVYECVSISDIRKVIDDKTADSFRVFMSHQTVPIIFGLSDVEQDFCYSHDWKNFLSGGRLFWD
jgi:hypothetical protein